MPLTVRCFMCESELDEAGALLFSPPNKWGFARKRHLCVECFKILELYFVRVKKEAHQRIKQMSGNG